MIYLVNTIKQFNGTCMPLSYNYKSDAGKSKSPSNISIASYNGQVIANTRLTDYLYIPIQSPKNLQYLPVNEDHVNIKTTNSIQPAFGGTPKIYDVEGSNRLVLHNSVTYRGIEDIRLVEWNGILYGIGFRPDIIAGKVIPQLLEYDEDLSIKRSWFMNTDKTMEKNWQPVVDKPFTFMYDADNSETITLDIDNMGESEDVNNPSTINSLDTPKFSMSMCGSSQLIHLHNGNYLSICHTSHRYTDYAGIPSWFYNHYFMLYDENMNKIWTSQPFHFVEECMEFCCGMYEHDGNIHISFSIMDGAVNIITIPYDSMMEIINMMMEGSEQLDCEPAYEYMLSNYESGAIAGTDRILYAFMLNGKSLFKHTSDIPGIINDINMPSHIRKCINSYFAIRMPDGAQLIKN